MTWVAQHNAYVPHCCQLNVRICTGSVNIIWTWLFPLCIDSWQIPCGNFCFFCLLFFWVPHRFVGSDYYKPLIILSLYYFASTCYFWERWSHFNKNVFWWEFLYFLHSISVLSFCIDVVLTLSICYVISILKHTIDINNIKQRNRWKYCWFFFFIFRMGSPTHWRSHASEIKRGTKRWFPAWCK